MSVNGHVSVKEVVEMVDTYWVNGPGVRLASLLLVEPTVTYHKAWSSILGGIRNCQENLQKVKLGII